MADKHPMLGILGGLGPMSTVYFCELLTAHTQAFCDADHIDMIISSRASTPDRTAFILGNSTFDPRPVMIGEAERLVRAGAEILVIPCNTAHYFYEGLARECPVPILNIIRETVQLLKKNGVRCFGLLATEGTVRSEAYGRVCREMGVECVCPTEQEQAIVTHAIYECIKQGKPVDAAAMSGVCASLLSRGCEVLVLGCTELSLLKKQSILNAPLVDSLEVLAYRTIRACKKTPVGFPTSFWEDEK